MLCVYVCATGVRGECGEPGEVRAGDQVPTATVSLSRRYLGDRRGEPTSSLVPNSLASCQVCPTFLAFIVLTAYFWAVLTFSGQQNTESHSDVPAGHHV